MFYTTYCRRENLVKSGIAERQTAPSTYKTGVPVCV
ncbi:hypothetical protein [Buttiauxella gaviniae]